MIKITKTIWTANQSFRQKDRFFRPGPPDPAVEDLRSRRGGCNVAATLPLDAGVPSGEEDGREGVRLATTAYSINRA